MSNFIRNPWCKLSVAVREKRNEFFCLREKSLHLKNGAGNKRIRMLSATLERMYRGYMSAPNLDDRIYALDFIYVYYVWRCQK